MKKKIYIPPFVEEITVCVGEIMVNISLLKGHTDQEDIEDIGYEEQDDDIAPTAKVNTYNVWDDDL